MLLVRIFFNHLLFLYLLLFLATSNITKIIEMNMKSTLVILAVSATAVGAFQAATSSHRARTSLSMGGFLEGRGQKITIREDEDNAMWIDDGAGGRKAEPKKPEPKKPVKVEAKKEGFKFPWDK